jgi:hypothetical protein
MYGTLWVLVASLSIAMGATILAIYLYTWAHGQIRDWRSNLPARSSAAEPQPLTGLSDR